MMMTTLTQPILTARAARIDPPAEANPAVPRHLAMALNGRAESRAASFDAACLALRAIVGGCAENGIAVLTLLSPPGGERIFEAALASVRASIPNTNDLKINLSSGRHGRAEIVEALRKIARQARSGELSPENIGAEKIENALSTRGLPPIDLMIETGGSSKLGGSLLWQCAYAELLFLEAPWFEFRHADFEAAIADFAKRSRKFGGLK